MGYCTFNGQKAPGTHKAVCESSGGTWVTGNEPPPDDDWYLDPKRYWKSNDVGDMLWDAGGLYFGGGVAKKGVQGIYHGVKNSPKIFNWMKSLIKSPKAIKNKAGDKIPKFNRQGNKLEVDAKGKPVWARNSKGEIIKVKKRGPDGKVIKDKNGRPIMVNKQRSVPNWVRNTDKWGNPAFMTRDIISPWKAGAWATGAGAVGTSIHESEAEEAERTKLGLQGINDAQKAFDTTQSEELKKIQEKNKRDNMSFFDKFKLGMQDPDKVMQLGMLMDYYGKNLQDRGPNPLTELADMRPEGGVDASQHRLTQMKDKALVDLFMKDKSFMFGPSEQARTTQANRMLAEYRTVEKYMLDNGMDASHNNVMAMLKAKNTKDENIAYA